MFKETLHSQTALHLSQEANLQVPLRGQVEQAASSSSELQTSQRKVPEACFSSVQKFEVQEKDSHHQEVPQEDWSASYDEEVQGPEGMQVCRSYKTNEEGHVSLQEQAASREEIL